MQAALVVSVHQAGRGGAEVQRRRAHPPDVAYPWHDPGQHRHLGDPPFDRVPEPGRDQRVGQVRGSRTGQRHTVAGRTVPERRGVGDAQGGRVHDPGDHLPVDLGRDRHRPVRQVVEEVHRAVQRIDDPAHPARARVVGPLLAQQAVARTHLAQPARDQLLGRPVECGDDIRGGRLGRLGHDVTGSAPQQQVAGLPGDVEREREQIPGRRSVGRPDRGRNGGSGGDGVLSGVMHEIHPANTVCPPPARHRRLPADTIPPPESTKKLHTKELQRSTEETPDAARRPAGTYPAGAGPHQERGTHQERGEPDPRSTGRERPARGPHGPRREAGLSRTRGPRQDGTSRDANPRRIM